MSITVLVGDCREVLRTLPDASIHCCVTSPPYYGLRDYGADRQIGLEETPGEYVEELVAVFREVHRVLRDDGALWLNLGDSYAANQSNNGGYSDTSTLAGFTNPQTKGRVNKDATKPRKLVPDVRPKNLLGIPWRIAFALQADGWYLRSSIIWHKPNAMPESVTDRPTSAHENVFLLAKSERYYFDADSVREENKNALRARDAKKGKRDSAQCCGSNVSGRNIRNVWSIPTQPSNEAHIAMMATGIAERCILAGCPAGGIVLDPFGGAGTTGLVAQHLGRSAVLIELNHEYAALAEARIREDRIGPVERLMSKGRRRHPTTDIPLFMDTST